MLLLLALLIQETKVERGETKVIVESTVKGALKSEYSGDYPFEYRGWAALTADEFAALSKEGKLADELAKRLAGAFAEPEPAKKKDETKDPKSSDEISAASFEVKDGKLTGKFTITRKEGAGMRKIVAEVTAKIEKEKVTFSLSSAKVTGSWDWGGGTVELSGSAEKFEAETRAPRKE